MHNALHIAVRFLLLVSAVTVFALDVSEAHAQSQNCDRLISTLASLERNSDYRELRQSIQSARTLQKDVQRAESAYVRNGCNDMAKRGQTLTRECKALARNVLSARQDAEEINRSVDTGNAVAQQREGVLQQMARFNCDDRSSANVFEQDGQPDRRNLFEQLFDAMSESFDGAGGFRGDDFMGYGSYETVRTVCVRKSDGYFWPISYSTLIDYAPNDATQCQEQCPSMDVDLYYYDNPGQEPEQMINLNGEPYTSLPNAFLYRTVFDKANSCKVAVNYGAISLAVQPDGQNRAIVSLGDQSFPLPLRDPRQAANVVVAAVDTSAYVDVPLPRPRPPAPGETPKPSVITSASAAEPERIVLFGDKRVRIVGPDTPYAPSTATGT